MHESLPWVSFSHSPFTHGRDMTMRRCIHHHLHSCVSARKKWSLRYQPWYRNGTVSGLTFVGSCRSLIPGAAPHPHTAPAHRPIAPCTPSGHHPAAPLQPLSQYSPRGLAARPIGIADRARLLENVEYPSCLASCLFVPFALPCQRTGPRLPSSCCMNPPFFYLSYCALIKAALSLDSATSHIA